MRFSFALAGALAASVNALQTIEVVGNKFFTKDGAQYFMKGNDVPQPILLRRRG